MSKIKGQDFLPGFLQQNLLNRNGTGGLLLSFYFLRDP